MTKPFPERLIASLILSRAMHRFFRGMIAIAMILFCPSVDASFTSTDREMNWKSATDVTVMLKANIDGEDATAFRQAADANDDGVITAQEVEAAEVETKEAIEESVEENKSPPKAFLGGKPRISYTITSVSLDGLEGSVNATNTILTTTRGKFVYPDSTAEPHVYKKITEESDKGRWVFTASDGYEILDATGLTDQSISQDKRTLTGTSNGEDNIEISFGRPGGNEDAGSIPSLDVTSLLVAIYVVLVTYHRRK